MVHLHVFYFIPLAHYYRNRHIVFYYVYSLPGIYVCTCIWLLFMIALRVHIFLSSENVSCLCYLFFSVKLSGLLAFVCRTCRIQYGGRSLHCLLVALQSRSETTEIVLYYGVAGRIVGTDSGCVCVLHSSKSALILHPREIQALG